MEPVVASSFPLSTKPGPFGLVIRELPRDLTARLSSRTAAARTARRRRLGRRGGGDRCRPRLWPRLHGRCGGCRRRVSVIVFLDGDGADRGDLLGLIAGPVMAGAYDFVLASRTRATREPGAMSGTRCWPAASPGSASARCMACDTATCAPTERSAAMRCWRLDMRELTYGWNIEMQMKAARAGLRITEVPLPYRCRVAGHRRSPDRCADGARGGRGSRATFVRVAMARNAAPERDTGGHDSGLLATTNSMSDPGSLHSQERRITSECSSQSFGSQGSGAFYPGGRFPLRARRFATGAAIRPECSQTNSMGCQDKDSTSFLQKEAKNSYLVSSKLAQHPTQRAKVFWFFFSKKNAFFVSALFWLPYFSDGH